MYYFQDLDENVNYAICTEGNTKKILLLLTEIFNVEFDEVDSTWADDYIFEKPTIIINVNHFNEDLLEVLESGYHLYLVK